MLLKEKIAVVYGAGESVGSRLALAYANQSAKVWLAGPHLSNLEPILEKIRRAGGSAQVVQIDATQEREVTALVNEIVTTDGRLDISFNSTGIPQEGIQGIPLVDLPLENFLRPLSFYLTSHLLTSRAAIPHMIKTGGGVLLLQTPEPAKAGMPFVGGMGPAWNALEGLTRQFSAEYASKGIRAVSLRTTGIPETPTYAGVIGLHAKALGIANEQFQAFIDSLSHRRRATTLDEVADAAVFVASSLGKGFTGTTLNLTGGEVSD